jgi:hypothetical protein
VLRLLNDLCPSAPSMLASFLQPVLASFLQHVLAMLPYPAPMSELAQCNQNLPKSTSKARPTKKSDPQAGNQADTALLEGHMGPAQQVWIQSALRMHLAKQHLRKSCCAACVIQACSTIPCITSASRLHLQQ